MKEKIIGQITWFDSEETVTYTDRNEFLDEFKDTLNDYGITGWKCKIFNDEDLEEEIYKILNNEFGYAEEND